MNTMSETERSSHRSVIKSCLVVGAIALYVAAAASTAAPPTVNGKLDRLGPYRVLRVWGSPDEMGFAHGYLVGAAILDYLNEECDNLTLEQKSRRSAAAVSLAGLVELSPDLRAEIEGVYEGIVAKAGKEPIVEAYGRPLRVEDLIVLNAADMLRAFGCSGFTVWGDAAGASELITTRNFDYWAPGPKSLSHQLILVRDRVDRNKVATITWPAYIGAITGINEHGVCAFMHDGTGERIRMPAGKYRPLATSLMDMLERSSPEDAHARTEALLRGLVPYPFSYMVRVIAPRGEPEGPRPVRVFRVDGEGLSENGVEAPRCITTNHYLTGGFEAPPGTSEWSVKRYQRLASRLSGVMSPTEAWQALAAVSVSDQGFGTLHSLIVYPIRKRLQVALAEWRDGKVVAAASREPTQIDFQNLFGPWD